MPRVEEEVWEPMIRVRRVDNALIRAYDGGIVCSSKLRRMDLCHSLITLHWKTWEYNGAV